MEAETYLPGEQDPDIIPYYYVFLHDEASAFPEQAVNSVVWSHLLVQDTNFQSRRQIL